MILFQSLQSNITVKNHKVINHHEIVYIIADVFIYRATPPVHASAGTQLEVLEGTAAVALVPR